MSTIESLSIGDIAEQNGEYSRVSESQGVLFYALVDLNELDEAEIENAIHVSDMDEDKFEANDEELESEFFLKSGSVKVQANADNLDDARNEADEWCAYSQSSLEILNGKGDLLAVRCWYGCTDGVEDQEDPIKFGDFGYYADWEIF